MHNPLNGNNPNLFECVIRVYYEECISDLYAQYVLHKLDRETKYLSGMLGDDTGSIGN